MPRTLIDFMPVRHGQSNVVRMVVGRRGRITLEMELVLRFDYGASVPWVTRGAARREASFLNACLRGDLTR